MDGMRNFRAVLLSPLASLAFAAFLFVELLFSRGGGFEPGLLIAFLLTAFAVLIPAYGLVIFVGLPMHLLLSRFGLRSVITYVVVGTTVAVGYETLKLAGSTMPGSLAFTAYISYAICGALVSLVFWYIAVPPATQQSEEPASASRP